MKNLIIAGLLAFFTITAVSANDFNYTEVNTFLKHLLLEI